VEAVERFLLSLPAPYKDSCFTVCFRFQLLSLKCFRFHKNLTASTASASSSAFTSLSVPCFIKNVSAFGFSKSQMLSSLLQHPASFFKVLPLPQKFNRFHRFRFQLPLPLPHPWLYLKNCLRPSKFITFHNTYISTNLIASRDINAEDYLETAQDTSAGGRMDHST